MPQIQSPFDEPPRKESFGERQERLNTFISLGVRFILGVKLTGDEETAIRILLRLVLRSKKLDKWLK